MDWEQDGDPVEFGLEMYTVDAVEAVYALKHNSKISKRCVIEFPEFHAVKEHTRKIAGKSVKVKTHIKAS